MNIERQNKIRNRMTQKRLNGKRVAILATNGFQKDELKEPLERLKLEGAKVDIVSIKQGRIKSEGENPIEVNVDLSVESANEKDYNALILPGGLKNPDSLRKNTKAVEFVKDFFDDDEQKPVAAICHGQWLLAEADVIKDREVTSYGSIKTDLINAGANWKDREVVCDMGLVTSRTPDDLEAFCDKIVEEIVEGKHQLDEAA